jgi:hypothetical protein
MKFALTNRKNILDTALESYCMWVPKNLDKIRANARIGETMLPPEQWTQMFGLDLFTAEHQSLIQPLYTKSKKPLIDFARETISKEVVRRFHSEELWGTTFSRQFPGIMAAKAKPSKPRKKTKKMQKTQQPIDIFETATAVDSISQSLGTNYQERQMTITDLVNSIAGTGMKITIEPV